MYVDITVVVGEAKQLVFFMFWMAFALLLPGDMHNGKRAWELCWWSHPLSEEVCPFEEQASFQARCQGQPKVQPLTH